MSRNEWERGEITLPSAEWVGFRKALIAGYAVALRADFEAIQALHEKIKLAIKGKRGVDLQKVFQEHCYAERGGFKPKVLSEWDAQKALLKKDETTGKYKLSSPKKSDFPEPKQNMLAFGASDGSITLDNEKRQVRWSVQENNHACDHARESHMGQLLFRLLKGIKWTRGTGGALRGNDEYNREAGEDHAGGGGSYLKDRFGPLGDAEYERVHGFKPPKPQPNISRPLIGMGGYGRRW